METKSKSKVLSSGMHVAHCTTYRQSPWISPETALPKPGQKIAFVVDQGPSATDRYEEGAQDMAALIEEGIEKRLAELVYAGGFPVTIRDVKEAVRSLACATCRGSGLVRQGCKCIKSDGNLPSDRRYHRGRCEAGGVKYCACPIGAERYEADRVSTTNIVAPITREWHLFPADQYGAPEFLQLCTDQAKEQRAAGRLAIASALERYVESKR